MPIQKTDAIVLKTQKLGETSKILTLFTRKFGRIKVVAKGARGLKSRFFGSLEPLNIVAIVFYQKETRDLQLLSQADVIQSFESIKNNLEKYAFSVVVCEIILRSQYAEEVNPYLYKTISDFFAQLDQAAARFDNYFFWFMLKFLQILGFKPRFNECIVCGKKMNNTSIKFFSVTDGGGVCMNCTINGKSALPVSPATIHFLVSLELCPIQKISDINGTPLVVKESNFILDKFIKYHIEGLDYLRSMKFLDQVHPSSLKT